MASYNKSVSGALSPSGSMNKDIDSMSRSFSGSITPYGSLNTITSLHETENGILSFTGALGTEKNYGQAVNGVLSFTGSLNTNTTNAVSKGGALTPSGELSRSIDISRTFNGVLPPTGAINGVLVEPVDLTGAITPEGAIIFSLSTSVDGEITPSGVLEVRSPGNVRGDLFLVGNLNVVTDTSASVDGGITPIGELSFPYTGVRELNGGLTFNGVLGKAADISKTLSAVLAPSGNLFFRTGGESVLAGEYDLVIEEGATFARTFKWVDAEGTGKNLDDISLRMDIKSTPDATSKIASSYGISPKISLTKGVEDGVFSVQMTATVTAALDFVHAFYDIEAEVSGGSTYRLVEGSVSLSREVTA